jgi:hypothetical protein
MKRKMTFLLITLCSLISFLFADGIEPLGNPREVSTLDHLLWISTNSSSWGDDFIQTADIDATDTQNWNGGAGFSPIGYDPVSFSGTYNGQGHIIEYLYINRPLSNNVGLFGYFVTADVENIGVTNGIISGSLAVGGLVGNCYIFSTVSNSFFTGTVNGVSYTGGLIGQNYSSAVTSNSYFNGTVSGSGNNIGGLVGRNYSGCTIINSYSTGTVNGYSPVGGLVGVNYLSTVSNSFWDTETSGQSYSAAGTGKTIAQMKDVATFTDLSTLGLDNPWDFIGNPNDDSGNDDFWTIDGITNNGYPFLSWQTPEDSPLPVVLSSFTAIQTSTNFAQINWTTQSETNLLGYNLYRNTENSNSGSQKINPQMIYGENSTSGSIYSYTDEMVEYEQPYYYWLESVEFSGNTELFGPVSITLENPENNAPELPNVTNLQQNYPNPFNPRTTIQFNIQENETGTLSICNAKGQRIVRQEFQTGEHSYDWNADKVTSGIYFYKLQTQSFNQIKKMILMK